MADKILLPNSCSMSKPSVNPKDWQSGGRSLLHKNWQIQYYFYDPTFEKQYPYGKLIVVKNMNSYKDLEQRRKITKALIKSEIDDNENGYNPILKRYIAPDKAELSDVHAHLDIISAFRLALKNVDGTEAHKKQIRWAINRIERSARKLKLSRILISNLKRKQIKKILDNCQLPDNYFNKYRSYLSRLFTELVEEECCETNLIRDIRKKKIVRREREILSADHLHSVLDHLHNNYYLFWRYTKIFLFSGARTSELFRVKAKDVDIEQQEFKVLIKKGQMYKEHIKVILKDVIPLWTEIMQQAGPNDYLFSKGLVPGNEPVSSTQITKRWYRLVKGGKITDSSGKVINITADFYALKHSMLDSLAPHLAQKLASHNSEKTTTIYQVNKKKRERQELKDMEVTVLKVV